MRREDKGITMISLIVTIIVMLILAGISINVALKEGKDSVIGEAKNRIEEQNAMVTNISISSNGVLENQIMDWGF